jgi:hypothetical protein
MISMWVAVPLGLFLFLVAVLILSFAVAIETMVGVRLVYSVFHPRKLLGTIIAALIWGPFAALFGYGAYTMAASVMDGLLGRLF